MSEIVFREIRIEDKQWMSEKFAEDDRNACEYSFANNFVWRNAYQIEVAEAYGCAIARFYARGERLYSYPIGRGNRRRIIATLLEECKEKGEPFKMLPVTGADKKDLARWFPGQFFVDGIRYDYDYVYSREKLATLAGTKMHGKRNHIARFKELGDWSYETITDENMEECVAMGHEWVSMHTEEWNAEMEAEMNAVYQGFEHWKELGLVGGLLRLDGKVVAFTVGERLNSNTFVVHFEKAFPQLQGAYPMINQQFVQHECADYEYVNREEDTGDLGLRRAKLSYEPEILLKKYMAVYSPIAFAEPEYDRRSILEMWNTCFGDSEEGIRFYLDRRLTDENMLVIWQDGKPVSMASFFPTEYVTKDEVVPAKYVYAVATLPEYRDRGLASQILSFAQTQWKQPLILSPAEQSLVEYYGNQGFLPKFEEQTRIIPAMNEEQLRAEIASLLGTASGDAPGVTTDVTEFTELEITAEEYRKLRDLALEQPGYVRWDEDAIQFAMDYNTFYGGRTIKLCGQEKGGAVAMYHTENGQLKITELFAVLPGNMTGNQAEKDHEIQKNAAILSEKLKAEAVQFLLQTEQVQEAVCHIPGGMLLPSERDLLEDRELPETGYLNLALD